MINRDRLVKTLCDLVRIDSPSGEEEAMAQALMSRLRGLGLSVARDAYGNVIAGDGRDGPLLLSAHMDTVEPGRGIEPRVEGDRVLSAGDTVLGGDCKAGIAAILESLESLREDGVAGAPVQVAFTRQEEVGLVGARNLDFSMLRARQAVVFDGEGPPRRITSGSPTYVSFDVEIKGRAAHAGIEPEKGVSAIRAAAELISRLPQGRLDRETTFNVGVVAGGTVRNAVPERATLKGEFRSHSQGTLDGLRLRLHEVMETVRRLFPEADVEGRLETQFEAYRLTDDDPATRRVKAALGRLGQEPEMVPSGGGTDGNIFRCHGISAVVVGMADHNAHTTREYVSVPDMVDAARLCEALMRG